MKTIHNISIIVLFAAVTSIAAAQSPDEYLGLPGDNLNLYAVMNLFQESETIEAFERNLNDQKSTINNLDLNGDNLIDYITVSDYVDKDVHNIVLRAALNGNEQQDIAVFVVEKLKNGEVQIQLIGDEALYGRNYIVEPIYAETPNPGYTGDNRGNVSVATTSYYQVAAWPVIRYVYQPGYVVWRSSWYWGYYPTYWNPWAPHYWHYYYGYHSHWNNHYHNRYRHWDHYRSNSYTTYYRNRVRVYSPTVVVNINKGNYRDTYSRPSQRRAGEQYYAQTAGQRTGRRQSTVSTQPSGSRSATVDQSQGARRTTGASSATRSRVSTTQRSQNAVRSSTGRSSSQSRSNSSVNRSTNQRNTPAVSRSSNQSSNPSVQNRSSQSRSNSSVSKNAGQRSTSAVTRSSSSQSRTNSSVSRNAGQRSTNAVTRSSSQRSKPSVQNGSSQRKSSSSVSKSSGKRSTPSAPGSGSSRSSSKNSGSRTNKNSSSSASRR